MGEHLVVVVPTRGRPAAALDLANICRRTCTARGTSLVFAVEDEDPCRDEYSMIVHQGLGSVAYGPYGSMVAALNAVALDHVGTAAAVAFLGDDHRPRTDGWDQAYLDTLQDMGPGIAYGNDLLQKSKLPTQAAVSADIVEALGYMAPPELTHLYVDNFWRDLGTEAECVRYLPDVVVEHAHPVAGKTSWDDGYRRVNSQAMYQADKNAYRAYRSARFADDVAKVRRLRGA